MPKEAARIWLKVTDVRMERLQDMTMDDFLNEGISIPYEAFNDPENAYMQAKKTFKHIWNSTINKKQFDLYEWDANPLVWVIEFARCKKKIFDEFPYNLGEKFRKFREATLEQKVQKGNVNEEI